jgi:hypothetical protein
MLNTYVLLFLSSSLRHTIATHQKQQPPASPSRRQVRLGTPSQARLKVFVNGVCTQIEVQPTSWGRTLSCGWTVFGSFVHFGLQLTSSVAQHNPRRSVDASVPFTIKVLLNTECLGAILARVLAPHLGAANSITAVLTNGLPSRQTSGAVPWGGLRPLR